MWCTIKGYNKTDLKEIMTFLFIINEVCFKMKFDWKTFKENRKTLILIIIIVVTTMFLSLLINSLYTYYLKEQPLIESGAINTSKLIISEVSADNNGMFTDDEGEAFDWVELYNGSNEAINLSGYGLSDVYSKTKWKFPEVIIESKQYLIVHLASANRNGLYANFALKKDGGETLLLINNKGAVIDALDVFAVGKYQSMARDQQGVWHATSEISPGFENSKEGHEAFMASRVGEPNGIVISEVLPRNRGNFLDSFNEFSGFIEITNLSETTVDLEGYTLGNSDVAPYRYRLPKRVLKPNEALVVYTSNRNLKGDELHSNFNLESQNGTVTLSNPKGQIIDTLRYDHLANGFAMIRVNDDVGPTAAVSPGYINTTAGMEAYHEQLKHPKTLLINEVMNRNYEHMPHNGYQFYDWVELLNNSKSAIDLSEYTLSTSHKDMAMANLPNVILQPNETLVLMASGDSQLTTSEYIHVNFKIGDIDSLYLSKNDKLVDSLFVGDVPVNYSYGRVPSGGFGYFSSPTPNASNEGSYYRSVASEPIVASEPGVYNDNETKTITASSTSPIYYTLDGSVPTMNSTRYTQPLHIDTTSTVRFRALEPDRLGSATITNDFIMNEDHIFPVMSLSLNSSDLSYLQGNPWVDGLEVPVHVAFYEEDNSFSIDAGLKLFGGSARGFAKKSFMLKFKGKYKEPKLNYPMFDNRDFTSFDTVVLRSGSQDMDYTFFRDVFGTSLADGMMEVEVQAFKPIVLYINGRYWGVYNVREKVDENFISSHFNVDDSANVVRIDSNVTSGSASGYQRMVSYAVNNDMRQSHHFEHMKTLLNLESYIDFWIASTFTTNHDIINARFFNHPDVDNGRWHMIWYDLDFAMWNFDRNYYNYMVQVEGMSDFRVSTALFRNLVVNEEFQDMFVKRLSMHLKTTFHPDRIYSTLDEFAALYRPEMARNQARWNKTMAVWESEIKRLRSYFDLRYDYLLRQTQQFFNLTNQEMELYFGGL